MNDAEAISRARLFVRSQASAFNDLGGIWAPRYRQATFGAFLTEKREGAMAIEAAYRDVKMAFDVFLRANPDRPILLAGHSQGSLHLLRLMKEEIAGTPLADRVVAAYAIGWPVSITADLPALGLPACTRRGQPGCVLSWQSYGEPADPQLVDKAFDAGVGLTGQPRAGTQMLCINPLTGTPQSAADAAQNLGTLLPNSQLSDATIRAGLVPARCDARGHLLIGSPPDLGPYVLPGNNYHVYDYALFWANIRRDATERLDRFRKAR